MSDLLFIAATIVFYAICALYVRWCDTIVGPDDFSSVRDHALAEREDVPSRDADLVGSNSDVTTP